MAMASYVREEAEADTKVHRKATPGIIVRAFAVFGTFTVAAAGAIGHFYGYSPTQLDLAFIGFFGGIAGALYAANFEGQLPDDRRGGW